MPDFTNLLKQTTTDHSDREETLEQTCQRHSKDWTDEDLENLIKGFRTLRSQWEINEAEGSRKRVSTKKVTTRKGKVKIPAGLKLKIKKPVV